MPGDVSTFMKVWMQSDADSERKMKVMLLDSMDEIILWESDVLSKIKLDKPIAGPVVRWMEEWGYPSTITARLAGDALTFTGYLFGQEVNAESITKVIRVGTILERRKDGCQVKIVTVDALSASVTAYGNTLLSDDPEPSEWEIISEAWSDYRDAAEPRSLDRNFREVGTQIFAETFEIPKTRKHTKYQMVPCEVEHQIGALLLKLRRQLAYSVLRSRPFHSGTKYVYGDKTPESTMCGICSWPAITHAEQPNHNVFVDKGSQALTKTDLDNLIRRLWLDEHADFHKGDWAIVCRPETHSFIQDFDISHRRMKENDQGVGFRVDEFHSKIGKSFPIMPEQFMRPGVLIVVNFDAFTYGYYAHDALERREIPTQGRYQRWLISFQTYGVVARNPRANIGMIFNLPAD